MRAVGGRAAPLGMDRRGRTFYVFGPCPTEVWVEDPAPSHNPPLKPGDPDCMIAIRARRKWTVVRSAKGLADLCAWLHPGGEREGPLRDAITRIMPLLLAGLQLSPAPPPRHLLQVQLLPASPAPPALFPSARQCSFCGGLSGPVGSLLLQHCHVTHVSFPVSSTRGLSGPAFAAHTAAAWEAAATRPVARAVAVLTAAQCAAEAPLPQSAVRALVAAAAASLGAPLDALAEALDPRLLRLKRLSLAIAGAVDFSRLRCPAHWPPSARAQWAHAVTSAHSAAELLTALGALEAALRADDVYAAAAANGGQHVHRPLLDAWLPPWYLQCVPSAGAALAVPTLAAVALRLHALQRALAPCSHAALRVHPA